MKRNFILGFAKLFSYIWLLIPTKLRRYIFTSFFILESRQNNPLISIKNLFLIKDKLDWIINERALKFGEGIHPKHSLTNYHDFFIERIKNGDNVIVFNDRGSYESVANITDDVSEGIIVSTLGYWRQHNKGTVNSISSANLADMGNAPTFSDNLLFTITIEGYLTILDPRNGNILRMTYILDKIKKPKKNKVYPTGFVVSTEEIYVSLNNGKLIIVDMLTGKSKEILKLSNDKISRPYFLNNNLYIVRNNAILKIN